MRNCRFAMEIVMKSVSLLVLGAVALGLLSSSALAASQTFVSGAGNDSGACGLAAPCRTFAYAITQTSVSGEIVILDSAGYGPVTITQSVTISNPGGVRPELACPAVRMGSPSARHPLQASHCVVSRFSAAAWPQTASS